MLYGIIADIHSNLEAFRTVLQELRAVDQIVCLGDIVGYGPDPNECVAVMQEKNIPTVAGNHDKAAIREMSTQWFNENARLAVEWTSEQLTDDSIAFLKSLPLSLEFEDFQIVHGSLRNPLEEYVTSLNEAAATIELMTKPLCFIGHSHIPLYVGLTKEGVYKGRELADKDLVEMSIFRKTLINPGGVGQPRDGDPRASFGIYDSEKKEFTLHRVEYNVQMVQEKMKMAGLPQSLIDRLKFGK